MADILTRDPLIQFLEEKAAEMRANVVKLTHIAGSGVLLYQSAPSPAFFLSSTCWKFFRLPMAHKKDDNPVIHLHVPGKIIPQDFRHVRPGSLVIGQKDNLEPHFG